MTHPEPVDSMMYPRYSGIATFMRLPHMSDPRQPRRRVRGGAVRHQRRRTG